MPLCCEGMSIPRHVTKAHATGNDFVLYFDPTGEYEPEAREIRLLCDRHRGIGGDGLIRVTRPQYVSDLTEAQRHACEAGGADWFMDYRNADGSLAEMCGNGTRATALFARREALFHGRSFRLGTRAGVKTLTSLGDVDPYGRNVFCVTVGAWKRGAAGACTVRIPGMEGSAPGTFVNMGNPHVVAVVSAADGVDCPPDLAAALRQATLPDVPDLNLTGKPVVTPVIPTDQNVEFIRVDALDVAGGAGEATMRVHERGCGETLSCGTGLCASAVTLRGYTGVDVWNITVPGGILRVEVTDEQVRLTGSATLVADLELL